MWVLFFTLFLNNCLVNIISKYWKLKIFFLISASLKALFVSLSNTSRFLTIVYRYLKSLMVLHLLLNRDINTHLLTKSISKNRCNDWKKLSFISCFVFFFIRIFFLFMQEINLYLFLWVCDTLFILKTNFNFLYFRL